MKPLFLLFGGLCTQILTGYATLARYPTEPLAISSLFNNQAAISSRVPGSVANFDVSRGAYYGQFLPTGSWEYDGLTVSFSQPNRRCLRCALVFSPIFMGSEARQRASEFPSTPATEAYLRARTSLPLRLRYIRL